MYYKVLGKDSPSVDTVVLSSGLGGVHGFWQPQLAMLAEQFRVVLYDQQGTGVSQGEVPAGYRMEDMADELAGLLNELHIDRCHIVGHALGELLGCIWLCATLPCCKVWWWLTAGPGLIRKPAAASKCAKTCY